MPVASWQGDCPEKGIQLLPLSGEANEQCPCHLGTQTVTFARLHVNRFSYVLVDWVSCKH